MWYQLPQVFRAVAYERHEVHIIGASGRSGAALCRSLAADGAGVRARGAQRGALGGDRAAGQPRWPTCGRAGAAPRLAGADAVVSCAHARHAPAILDAAPARRRFVLLGSTRKFTRWPDAHGRACWPGRRRSAPPAGAA